ncbi:tRNA A-37 threonylcarbamoyl transferase component Bud32 [Salirhabdus euzebyi]|uniref:tRNA A-37 threonylcarbamoyl transferase component Bud32 n=1 Tax=Salirhabdus euzebyi TaxID=394506 RepID=A0A841Q507_9BACI|nr:hypothetical protein [Salirhabdus euzebyi]MBB6453422.1 tRNA A-37 threonylcarbamoyl transferase component Bud32 [Salirhabdus euzebyi]
MMCHYFLPPLYYVPYYHNHRQPPYPEVNPSQFTDSAYSFQALLVDAQKIIAKLSDSKEFAKQVMDNAQKSNQAEVIKLVKETGITHPVDVSFTPDNIKIILTAVNGGSVCCKLVMDLYW